MFVIPTSAIRLYVPISKKRRVHYGTAGFDSKIHRRAALFRSPS